MSATTQEALDVWLASHPLRAAPRACATTRVVFVRLVSEPGPLSNAALHKLLGPLRSGRRYS